MFGAVYFGESLFGAGAVTAYPSIVIPWQVLSSSRMADRPVSFSALTLLPLSWSFQVPMPQSLTEQALRPVSKAYIVSPTPELPGLV